MRTLLLVGLLLGCTNASASVSFFATFTVVPAAPAAGEPVMIRVDADGGCSATLGGVVVVDVESRTILVRTNLLDFFETPCPPDRQTPRMRSIGSLPRGRYTVTFQVCGNFPPPEGPCYQFATEQLVVGGGEPVQVPASSTATLSILVLGLLLGVARIRA